jgi:hypothetical protein
MAHALVKIVDFQQTGASTLRIVFDDGKSNVVDFRPLLKGPLFLPLMDPDFFSQVSIDPEVGTLVWPNGADFDPDTLYGA